MDNQEGRSLARRNDLFERRDSFSSLGNDDNDGSARALRAVRAVVQNNSLLPLQRAAGEAILLRQYNASQRAAMQTLVNPFLRTPNALNSFHMLPGSIAQTIHAMSHPPILPTAIIATAGSAAAAASRPPVRAPSSSSAGIERKRTRQDPPGVVYTIDSDSEDSVDCGTQVWKLPRVDEERPTVPLSGSSERVKTVNFSKSVDPAGVTADSEEFQEMKKRHCVDLLGDDKEDSGNKTFHHASYPSEGDAPALVTSGTIQLSRKRSLGVNDKSAFTPGQTIDLSENTPKQRDAEKKARFTKQKMEAGLVKKQKIPVPSKKTSAGSGLAAAGGSGLAAAQKVNQGSITLIDPKSRLNASAATAKYSAGEATAENVSQQPKYIDKTSQPGNSIPNVSRKRRRHELPLVSRRPPEKRLEPQGVIQQRSEAETKANASMRTGVGTVPPVLPPKDIQRKKPDIPGHVNSDVEGTGYSTDSGSETSSTAVGEAGIRKHRLILPENSSKRAAPTKQQQPQPQPTQQAHENQKKEKLVQQKAAVKEKKVIRSKSVSAQSGSDSQHDQPHQKMQQKQNKDWQSMSKQLPPKKRSQIETQQQNKSLNKTDGKETDRKTQQDISHKEVPREQKELPSQIEPVEDQMKIRSQPEHSRNDERKKKEAPATPATRAAKNHADNSSSDYKSPSTGVSVSSGRQASVETGSAQDETMMKTSEKSKTTAARQPSTAPRRQESSLSKNQRELSLRSRKRTTRLSLDSRAASALKEHNILQSAKNIWKKVVKDRELEKSELLRKCLEEKRDKVIVTSSSYYNEKMNGFGEHQRRRIYPKRLRSSDEAYSKSESDFFCLPCNRGQNVDLRGFRRAGCKEEPQVVKTIDLHGAPPALPPSVASIILKVNHTVKDEKVLSHVPYFGDDDFEDLISDLFDTEERERRVIRGPAHEEDDKNEEIDETIRRLAVELEVANADELEKSEAEIQDAVAGAMREDKGRILERLKEVAREMREKGRPKAKAESEPKSSDPVEARYLDTIDSFRALFCTRCFTYDCNTHGGAEEDHGGMEKPSLQTQYERGISRERDGYWKESNEAFRCEPTCKLIKDENITELSEFQKGICSRLWLIFEGDIEQMADVMRAPEKLVKDFVDSEIDSSPTYQALVPVSKVDETGKKRNAMKNYHSMKNYNPKWLKRITNMEIHPYFTPCTHDGMCSDDNCSCIKNGFFCIKSCVWGEKSPNFFRGCDCKGGCKTNSCACYAARRECDPDFCKNCGACTDPPNAPATSQSCRNDNICMRRHCRLLVGKSSVPEAGWGLFTKDELKRGDYVHEYIGEVVSQDEAERRGRLYDKENRSFLFNQSSEYVVDATRKGNKTRFANHSKKPNCDTRLLFVDGDARIGFFANENIPAQSELFIDYKYDSELNNELIIKPGRTVDWMTDPKNAGKISKSRTSNRKTAN